MTPLVKFALLKNIVQQVRKRSISTKPIGLKGCPCPHYECETLADDRQRYLPVWNKKFSKTIAVDFKTNFDELIYRKSTEYVGIKDLHKIAVSPIYLFDFEKEKQQKIDLNGEDLYDHSAGSAFLNGKHYLVDARGKMMTISEEEPKLVSVTEAQNFERLVMIDPFSL